MTCHTKIWCFDILMTLSFSSRYLKNSKCREKLSLNCPYLPKDRSSERNSVVINPVPESFINQGRLTLITVQETRVTPEADKLCHKLSHLPFIMLRKDPFIFPKNNILFLRSLHPPFLC